MDLTHLARPYTGWVSERDEPKREAPPKEAQPTDAPPPKRNVVIEALKRAALRRTSTSR
jgi:hypothetical protein